MNSGFHVLFQSLTTNTAQPADINVVGIVAGTLCVDVAMTALVAAEPNIMTNVNAGPMYFVIDMLVSIHDVCPARSLTEKKR